MYEEYEQLLTLGMSPDVLSGRLTELEHQEFSVPVPDGDGWQLLCVIPHSGNQNVLQYFWQRGIEPIVPSGSLPLGLVPNIGFGKSKEP